MNQELAPCPFGGSHRCEKTPELDYRRGDGYRVRCGCGAVGPRPSASQDEDAETDEGAAIAAWNTRRPEPPRREAEPHSSCEFAAVRKLWARCKGKSPEWCKSFLEKMAVAALNSAPEQGE